MSVIHQSRNSPNLRFGISTRGALAWQRAAQTRALIHQRSFVNAYDLKFTAHSVLVHRLSPFTQNRDRESRLHLVNFFLDQVKLPT